jgi:hypothetical protein
VTSNRLKEVQNQIISNLNDPLVQMLLENSHFTKIQMETLLIDMLAEQAYGKKVTLSTKARLRSSKKNISKGSFSRTLQQSKTNMIKTLCTILLLGYLDVLQTPSLSPYIEASNRLESYMKEYYTSLKRLKNAPINEKKVEMIKILKRNVENELFEMFNELFRT